RQVPKIDPGGQHPAARCAPGCFLALAAGRSGRTRPVGAASRKHYLGLKRRKIEVRMFETLQDRLGSILNGLTGRGALSEADVAAALREVRRALLEADVALEVVRSFTDKVREQAVGASI